MKRAQLAILIVVVILGFLAVPLLTRFSVRESGHGFVCGDCLILGEYGYTNGGDRLRFAIFRTWPKDSTPAQRSLDTRTGRDFLGWPLVRWNNGRMIPVGTDGNIYFFAGDNLRTMKVGMNEHTDTVPLDNLKTVEEVWDYLEQFRIDNRE
jgi:hypothetical protein